MENLDLSLVNIARIYYEIQRLKMPTTTTLCRQEYVLENIRHAGRVHAHGSQLVSRIVAYQQ